MAEETKSVTTKNLSNAIFLLACVVAVVYLCVQYSEKVSSVILSLIGLGVVIFIHEMGHFAIGKLSGIRVEAFAVGFGPILLGIKKTEKGMRFRVLPTFFFKENDEDDEGLLCFRAGSTGAAGETEYQLRLIPVGGFVKLLGQEDLGADKPSEDPRSFVNVAMWKKIVTVSAGVVLNVVLAAVIFVGVFMNGIEMPPAVIGGVVQGFPAKEAGLQSGDEIIEVDGETEVDFTSVGMAAALSGKDEAVPLTVLRRDGSVEEFELVAKDMPELGIRGFGIIPAMTLTVANVEDANKLLAKTGFTSGDKIVAAEGKDIEHMWELEEIVKNSSSPKISVSVRREGVEDVIENTLDLRLRILAGTDVNDQSDLSHIFSMVPRIVVRGIGNKKTAKVLKDGDIIVKVADVDNPTFLELRRLTNEYSKKEMPIVVLRDGEIVEGSVKPVKVSKGKAEIGIGAELDAEHAVVAKTIKADDELLPLEIPSGAQIVSVDGEKVENFYDVIRIIRQSKGEKIELKYFAVGSDGTDSVTFRVPKDKDFIKAEPMVSTGVPFKTLKKLYKASGPIDAMQIGCRKTVMFIAQTYVTIKGLIMRTVSAKGLMGPVGMIAMSSKIISEGAFAHYFYFMGLISACLAVMNFLPLPILDGGLVLMLVIEKIKGSPVNIKIQEVITYIGLGLIGALFLWITYNDIVRTFFS